MNTQQLEGIQYKFSRYLEELKEAIAEAKKQELNVRLTKAECNEVMGYKDSTYIYSFDLDHITVNGHIWFNDLYEWAKEHKPNRLKKMRKNVKKLIK